MDTPNCQNRCVGQFSCGSCSHFALFSVFAALIPASLQAELAINLPPPASGLAQEIYDLHSLILWICAAIFIAVFVPMFVALVPGLDLLNIMRLHSPQSAILSAVIFNAIIIIALIPLSLRGVRYSPSSASKLLSRNLYVYGLGGLVAPFIGIKLIDLVIQFLPGM